MWEILPGMMTSEELQTLATQYSFPRRLLSEAQEVMLYEGWTPEEIRKDLPQLCADARAQGGSVEMFDRLLKGQIAVFRALGR